MFLLHMDLGFSLCPMVTQGKPCPAWPRSLCVPWCAGEVSLLFQLLLKFVFFLQYPLLRAFACKPQVTFKKANLLKWFSWRGKQTSQPLVFPFQSGSRVQRHFTAYRALPVLNQFFLISVLHPRGLLTSPQRCHTASGP